MAFRKLNDIVALAGFYIRKLSNPAQGKVTKFVNKKGGPFYVLELTADCQVQITDKAKKKTTEGIAKAGQSIGLPAVKTLEPLKEYAGKGVEVRVAFKGTTPSMNFPGKDVSLFDIEINDS
jgi:hypothetical protein